MKYAAITRRSRFAILAMVLAMAGPARGAELPGGHKHLVFAIAYRASDSTGSAGDFVVLGHYDFQEERTARVSYFFYDARRNHKPANTTQRHPRLAPGSAAMPGPVQIPTYTLSEQFRATWTMEQGVLRVRVGNVVHEWSLQDPTEKLFVPRGPYVNAENQSHTINGWTYGDTRGYAYLTDHLTLPRKITRDDLLTDYKGEIQTHQLQRGGPPQWVRKPSDLHVQRYQTAAEGDVLGHMVASRFVSTPTLVFSTLLLNYAQYSKLMLYHNGGHDFNHNGVFDEYGHSMQMFGIYDGSKITRIVYVEYTYQTAGTPILSVGHYFGPNPAPAPAAPAGP